MKVKIKILKGCAGADFSFQEGEVVEVDSHLAEDLVRAEIATYEKAVKKQNEKAIRQKRERATIKAKEKR